MTRTLELARVNDQGELAPLSLAEWAARFNADHRLRPPKKEKRK